MGINRLEYYADLFQKYVGVIANSYVKEDRTINDEILKQIKVEFDKHAVRICTSHKLNVNVIMEAHGIIWGSFLAAMVELNKEGKENVGGIEEG